MKNLTSVWMRRSGICLIGLFCGLLSAGPLQPQLTAAPGLEVTTQERLETEPWWPTMATVPLKAYAGSASCVSCHTEGNGSTAMQRAAERANDAVFLRRAGAVALQTANLDYRLKSSQQGLDYSVSDKGGTLSEKLAWVIGAGDLGRTFLYEQDGHWQQSELSFYTRPAALDITTGLGRASGDGLPAALGQQLSTRDAQACFGCHTVHATTSAGLEPLHAEPGIGCEACHGPSRGHETDMTRQALKPGPHPGAADSQVSSVFDPSTLSPADSIDFCGACHRTSADARLSTTQAFGSSVVRFQPYRLEESKCWRSTKDQRLTCVACHNPHQPLERNTLAYDKQCLQCHAPAAATPAPLHSGLVCPRATSNCVICHMPKVAVASMHGDFTDHYIRVVREGAPMPR